MHRTPIRVVLLTAAGVTIVGALLLRLLDGQGVHLPQVAWVEPIAILVLAAVIFWMGWAVRSYQKGRKPDLDPLRAARTFILAKAAALTGSILVGRYLAAILDVARDLDIASQRSRALAAGVAVLCSVALTVVGLVVEKFCEIPPPEDEGQHNGTHGPEPLAG